jgi:hypothetical protein
MIYAERIDLSFLFLNIRNTSHIPLKFSKLTAVLCASLIKIYYIYTCLITLLIVIADNKISENS